ncbi:MAG: HEPN family nuclease [Bacteroidota bacterium]|nr:HEPN family nuclease [Bacteroidota bacterium]
MGNFKDIEIEFVQRTLNLISQYESSVHKLKLEEQYNYTLLINCLLGLIVLPKEKSL